MSAAVSPAPMMMDASSSADAHISQPQRTLALRTLARLGAGHLRHKFSRIALFCGVNGSLSSIALSRTTYAFFTNVVPRVTHIFSVLRALFRVTRSMAT
eukprot:9296033-Pyramimonas_sp.AAC.4